MQHIMLGVLPLDNNTNMRVASRRNTGCCSDNDYLSTASRRNIAPGRSILTMTRAFARRRADSHRQLRDYRERQPNASFGSIQVTHATRLTSDAERSWGSNAVSSTQDIGRASSPFLARACVHTSSHPDEARRNVEKLVRFRRTRGDPPRGTAD